MALLGSRQVGKTTLARELAQEQPSIYLDLEAATDRAKLADPVQYLSRHENSLVVLDEVHRVPEIFQTLRGLIDQGRRKGLRTGRFLLLGPASIDLLKQSGESLAGRISFLEMQPLNILEVPADEHNRLWVRGGFPDSYLAPKDETSAQWRDDFIRTYLERDIPMLGGNFAAETLRRFWTMLAHSQGGLLNASEFGRSLGVSHKTVATYLDLLVDLLLVRRLEPWHNNGPKRPVKAPRIYVRDSGLVHNLLGLDELESILGHPVAGASWEGFVIEMLMGAAPDRAKCHFYRTAAGAEIDLLLTLPRDKRWAVEIKRSLQPKLERGFHQACEDLSPDRQIVVYPGDETFPMGHGVEAVPLRQLCNELAALHL